MSQATPSEKQPARPQSPKPQKKKPRSRRRWTLLRPPLEWAFRYPLLALLPVSVLLVLWAVIWDPLRVGRIGLPDLFWHESPWTQLAAGLGVAFMLGEVCFVGYLLDADTWLRGAGEEGRTPTVWWYFQNTLTYPAMVLLAAAPAALDWRVRWPLAAGLLGGAVVVSALAGWGRYLHLERLPLFDWMVNLPRIRDSLADPDLQARRFVGFLGGDQRRKVSANYRLHVLQLIAALLLAGIYLALYLLVVYYSPDVVSPALAICVLMALGATIYGFVRFHFPRRHFGVFVLLAAVGLTANYFVNYHHRFAGLDYTKPVSLRDRPRIEDTDAGLLDDEQVLAAWRGQHADRPVLVVVATKGGGLRSAAWTVAVLARLEDEIPAFPYHTRVITGASGGMLGAAYYVATLGPPEQPGHRSEDGAEDLTAENMFEHITRDSLSDPARHVVLPLRGDRGEALERAWEQNTAGALAAPLAGLRPAEQAGWLPSLVFAPMLVEDGRRLLISNLDLAGLCSAGGGTLDAGTGAEQPGEYSVSGMQFFQLFPAATGVRLSTVTRMNASFPYISPDAELPTDPVRRVVDAAYYDRYGVNLAALWLDDHHEWLRDNTAGVLLVQIRDAPRDRSRFATEQEAGPGWRRALSRFSTPIEGAVAARESTMSFRNDELLALVDRQLNTASDPDFFATVAFELSDRAPLSWYLSPADRERIRSAVTRDDSVVDRRLDAVRAWWQARNGTVAASP